MEEAPKPPLDDKTTNDVAPEPEHGGVPTAMTLALPPYVGAVLSAIIAGWGLTVVWGQPMPVILATLLLGATLTALSVIDMRSLTLPDWLTLPLTAIGLAFIAVYVPQQWMWHAGAAALGFLLLWGIGEAYWRLRQVDGLGMGDAKLFAAVGAWTGLEGLLSALLIATFAALLAVVIMRVSRKTALPFGPFLALGLWVTWLYGPVIVHLPEVLTGVLA